MMPEMRTYTPYLAQQMADFLAEANNGVPGTRCKTWSKLWLTKIEEHKRFSKTNPAKTYEIICEDGRPEDVAVIEVGKNPALS